ncbi:MAG TPA: PQQ-dependent sugar dehydrogenase, partial [Candidatus Dormibacteraeota bacterium]|nr:PQQ-dependent sugar dehydrogenase [Candidatus Dormibacteraeota bacterium]
MLQRILAVSLAMVTLVACGTAARQQGTGVRPSKSPAVTQPARSPTPSTPKPPGALQFNQQSVAQELVAPWAIDFAKDGSAWLTERPGRVRVIRNGRLLTDPAVTISVATANGCEDGLLGIAIGEPYAYVYYTYPGSSGNTNRVSRFSMAGDKLVSEQVLVDGIPGGTCYHFGGRLKLGPD